jgi:hypothetical protein
VGALVVLVGIHVSSVQTGVGVAVDVGVAVAVPVAVAVGDGNGVPHTMHVLTGFVMGLNGMLT